MQEPAEGAPPGSQLSELQRLRSIVDNVNADTCVVPKGSLRLDASGKVVSNDGFQGVPYPDKLEAYIHGMVSSPPAADSHSVFTHIGMAWHDMASHSIALLFQCKPPQSIADLVICMSCLKLTAGWSRRCLLGKGYPRYMGVAVRLIPRSDQHAQPHLARISLLLQ